MKRSAYQRLRPLSRWILADQPGFDLLLQKAGIRERGDMYFSTRLLWMILVLSAGTLLLGLAGLSHVLGVWTVPRLAIAVLATGTLIAVGVIYYSSLYGPQLKAFMRGEEIDDNLPFAVNYLASVATANVAPERLFESLARQQVYGPIAREAAQINRDVNLLGRDLVAALSLAADRSPSATFEDFLDGAITSITAGGALHRYLEAKSSQYMEDRRQQQASFLDNLGLLAESYVTVAVAAPMFVIVLLTVLILFGTSGGLPLALGYLLMLVLVPLINAGFIVAVETISPKV